MLLKKRQNMSTGILETIIFTPSKFLPKLEVLIAIPIAWRKAAMLGEIINEEVIQYGVPCVLQYNIFIRVYQ